MANSAYTSGFNTDSLFVAAKAATVFAAHESSLFLTGGIVPVVNAPNGLLQVPFLDNIGAVTPITSEAAPGVDIDAVLAASSGKATPIQADLYAARSVVRDLGNIDPSEIGRVLGNGVAKAFDTDVITAMNGFTASTSDSDPVTVNALFDAAAQIRNQGEMGQLMGIISTAQAAELMKNIGTTSYGGGDFQSEAMRNGFMGQVAGIQLFQSSYITGANKGFIFSKDSMRIAMQRNVTMEMARRAEAVGQDVVASLMAGVGVIDATRGVKLINVA